MKIFGWARRKFNAKQSVTKPNSSDLAYHKVQEPKKEEFEDWPNGLLAIGTFGNQDSIDFISPHTPINPPPSQDLLHDEEMEKPDDELFDFPTRLEDEDDGQQRNGNVVVGRGSKDGCSDSIKSDITKRSFSFLLKKMLVSTSGVIASSSLRDQLPESRMEKILKALLHRKIYPHTSTSPTFSLRKKYLENKHMIKTKFDRDEVNEKLIDGSKWDKTDSEFIVLEI